MMKFLGEINSLHQLGVLGLCGDPFELQLLRLPHDDVGLEHLLARGPILCL